MEIYRTTSKYRTHVEGPMKIPDIPDPCPNISVDELKEQIKLEISKNNAYKEVTARLADYLANKEGNELVYDAEPVVI